MKDNKKGLFTSVKVWNVRRRDGSVDGDFAKCKAGHVLRDCVETPVIAGMICGSSYCCHLTPHARRNVS